MAARRIFICYRREDAKTAGRLYDRLKADFGPQGVFRDIDNRPTLGSKFRDYIEAELASCDFLLALVGPSWVEQLCDLKDDPRDLLRVELETAARLKIRIAPVMLDDAAEPVPSALPTEFVERTGFPELQSIRLRADPDFADDYQRIVREIRKARRSHSLPLRGVAAAALLVSAIGVAAVVVPSWRSQTDDNEPSTVSMPMATPSNEPVPSPAAAVPAFVPPTMVSIPGGTFVMGSPEDEEGRSSDEGPQHKVEVGPFLLDRTEVTFAEYDRFAEATGRKLPDDRGWGRSTQPVINVSSTDAQDYAVWLSARTGEQYRLATEAEWEYAARAGSEDKYWWGEEVQRGGQAMASCHGCGSRWDNVQSAPVGSFAQNPFGLQDMHGNVSEWTSDCWNYDYEGAPGDGSAWRRDDGKWCLERVVRGGSWGDSPAWVRSASRARSSWIAPHVPLDRVGFRLARTLP